MKRTKLHDRELPGYTRGEEIFNMVSHIVGGGFGVIALVACVLVAAFRGNVYGIVSAAIYGTSMVALYTMSSIYHGLKTEHFIAKRVMQILDHCTIFILIAGTYTPIMLCGLRPSNPVVAWIVLAAVWALAALGITFNAIDLKKYKVFSMICYIGMGWCIVLTGPVLPRALTAAELGWLLAGGVAYTVGAVFYGFGKRVRYIHSVFHLFVVLGSILQFVTVLMLLSK